MGDSDISARSPDFFIFGCQNSGTTLLSILLSERRDFWVVCDSFVYGILNQQGRARRTQRGFKALSRATGSVSLLSRAEASHLPPIDEAVSPEVASEYLDALKTKYGDSTEGNALGHYVERLDQPGSGPIAGATSYRDLVNAVLTSLIPDNMRHKPFLGEMTPVHSHMQEWLRAGFPSAQAVVLVRHPITNVAAIFQRLQSGDALGEAIRIYRSYYEVGLKDLVQRKMPGVTILRYEDLVAAPGDIVGSLTKTLGGTDPPIADAMATMGGGIEAGRDQELPGDLLDDRQQLQVLSECAAVIDRFYLV